MNPIGLEPSRFIIITEEDRMVGFGQLECKAKVKGSTDIGAKTSAAEGNEYELRSLIVEPEFRCGVKVWNAV